MKNKILITVVFASFGFAIFALFNDLQKAKAQIYYSEGTGISSVNSKNNVWKSTSISKKKYNKRKIYQDKEWTSETNINNKIKGKNSFLNASVPDLAFNQPAIQQPPIGKKREKENLSTNMGVSGVFLARTRNINKNNNENLLVSSSNYSSSVSSIPGSFMGAPAETNDDIIIDPGTDPTNPPIPIGDGMYAMMMLIGVFAILKFYKKNHHSNTL